MNILNLVHCLMVCYVEYFKDFSQKTGLNQGQIDILLFLKVNPEMNTARDIEVTRKIRANLISVNVDKLVHDGYLTRKKDESDRRRVNLHLTEKSEEIANKAEEMHKAFFTDVLEGIDKDTEKALKKAMGIIEGNIERMNGRCRE